MRVFIIISCDILVFPMENICRGTIKYGLLITMKQNCKSIQTQRKITSNERSNKEENLPYGKEVGLEGEPIFVRRKMDCK